MSKTKKTVYAALCAALAVVLPLAFHSVPNAGSIFLPMHIPVLLCGFICGWPFGLACGALAPLLSSLLMGMPPAAYLPGMVFELAVYGFVSGVLFRRIRMRNSLGDIYVSLAGAMLCGRVVSGVLNALIFCVGKYSLSVWVSSAFVTALPGILIQLALLPVLVLALEKAKLIEKR